MILTKQKLFDNGACISQVTLFGKKYPDGVRVTRELCVSLVGEFDFRCPALRVLVPDLRNINERQYAELESIRARHRAELEPIHIRLATELATIRARQNDELAKGFGELAELIED